MKDIGNGKFSSISYNGYSTKSTVLSQNEGVFDMSEVWNIEAGQKSKVTNQGDFFYTDVLFDDFKLIETIMTNVDLYELDVCNKRDGPEMKKMFNSLREITAKSDKGYISLSDTTFISTHYNKVDKFYMKYKISTKLTSKIAYLTVMNIPDEGLRVTSFVVF